MLQLFIGMTLLHHRADRAIFVTTSSFRRPARALAQKHDIRLIDGHEFARLL
ncbi:MAG: restriction endonuclease [Chloroflexi bacterium]|nr:restriction endonuclease [Chloroflexota bacterium]